jgi:hypothetical protein
VDHHQSEGFFSATHGLQPAIPKLSIVEVLLMPDSSEEINATCLVQADLPAPIQQLLESFSHIFAEPNELPPSRMCDHSIPLVEGAQPVSVRPYWLSPAMKNEIEQQVQDMLLKGIIMHNNSAFSSPHLLVKKKDQTWRFCVDYRHLNALTMKFKYPVPILDELLDELHGASWFSSLDLRAGFHQIFLKPGEEYKIAFQTHLGHFEFRVMAFGLTGAPDTFQRAMNTTLQPILRNCALVFFDDILIYSATFDDHLKHLQQVLEPLAADQWKVKLSKCTFAQNQVAYLGHVISKDGVATNLERISAIASWLIPHNAKELISFLGLVGYYSKFVRHIWIISQSLTSLLKKGLLLVWTFYSW